MAVGQQLLPEGLVEPHAALLGVQADHWRRNDRLRGGGGHGALQACLRFGAERGRNPAQRVDLVGRMRLQVLAAVGKTKAPGGSSSDSGSKSAAAAGDAKQRRGNKDYLRKAVSDLWGKIVGCSACIQRCCHGVGGVAVGLLCEAGMWAWLRGAASPCRQWGDIHSGRCRDEFASSLRAHALERPWHAFRDSGGGVWK